MVHIYIILYHIEDFSENHRAVHTCSTTRRSAFAAVVDFINTYFT